MRRIFACGTLTLFAALPFCFLTACKSASPACRYEIEAEYFQEGRLDGNMKVSVPNNTQNALYEIPFALYANAFRKDAKTPPVSNLYSSACYYGGESYGGIEVGEVKGGKSWCIGGEDENLLIVSLEKPLYPNESVTLEVSYCISLARASHRLGIGRECVNLSCFYPQLFAQSESGFYEYSPAQYGESFVLDNADFSVRLTVPESLKAACGGRVEEKTENGKRVYSSFAENVRDTVFVLGDFSLVSAERAGVKIDYFYFKDASPEATLAAGCDAIESYSRLFGQYPYERFVLAESNLFHGGAEYSGFAVISHELQGGERAEVVAHETAHQWWYSLVGSNQAECAWQDEGLAEYSVALFYEKNPAYKVSYREFVDASQSAYRSYFSVNSQLNKEISTAMTRSLKNYSGDYEYRILSYDKGVVLLDRLRGAMGDKKFFSSLENYVKKCAGKTASEYDFISCFPSQGELIRSFTEGRCVV